MAITGASWAATLQGLLGASGFTGSQLLQFCLAVGNGSESHVVGASFSTVDVGTIPGVGSGTGVGITGIVGATIASAIYSSCTSAFGQSGAQLIPLCTALGNTCVAEMLKASLSSSHAPVFAGAGTITPGSISVNGSDWGSGIEDAGASQGMAGDQWPSFASAVGNGYASGVLTGTGAVAIVGSPTGVPVPGGGAGSGSIS